MKFLNLSLLCFSLFISQTAYPEKTCGDIFHSVELQKNENLKKHVVLKTGEKINLQHIDKEYNVILIHEHTRRKIKLGHIRDISYLMEQSPEESSKTNEDSIRQNGKYIIHLVNKKTDRVLNLGYIEAPYEQHYTMDVLKHKLKDFHKERRSEIMALISVVTAVSSVGITVIVLGEIGKYIVQIMD